MDILAINGGPKITRRHRSLPWPCFDENAIAAVTDTLRSGKVNYWTGNRGMEFERRYAAWQGSASPSAPATAQAPCTRLAGLGIGPGDEVIVPSYTFIATSFSVVQAGAIPRFADVNRDDHCMSVESVPN
jgi:dTDP-4-amino-4,6-dideoxygalactose transaminase